MAANETFFNNICPELETTCIVTFTCAVIFFISTVVTISIIICLCRKKGLLCPTNRGKYQLQNQDEADEEYAYDQQHLYQSFDDNYPTPSPQAEREQSEAVNHAFVSDETDEDNSDKQQVADQDLEAQVMKTDETSQVESENIKHLKPFKNEFKDELLDSKKEQEVDTLSTQSRESESKTNQNGRKYPYVEETFKPRVEDSFIPVESNDHQDFADDDRKIIPGNKLDQASSNTVQQDSEEKEPRDSKLVSRTGSAIKVQVFYKKEVSKQATKELMSKLKERKGHLVDYTYLSDLAKADPASPLLITCLNATRLGTDAVNAVKGIQNPGKAVLLVIQYKPLHALPTARSAQLLTQNVFKDFGGIFDMAYDKDVGMYNCDMNTDCISNIEHYLREFFVP